MFYDPFIQSLRYSLVNWFNENYTMCILRVIYYLMKCNKWFQFNKNMYLKCTIFMSTFVESFNFFHLSWYYRTEATALQCFLASWPISVTSTSFHHILGNDSAWCGMVKSQSPKLKTGSKIHINMSMVCKNAGKWCHNDNDQAKIVCICNAEIGLIYQGYLKCNIWQTQY
jgi:hypothetical protein